MHRIALVLTLAVATLAIASAGEASSVAVVKCPSAGTPAPGSTVTGGIEVDGFCQLDRVTVYGGITVDATGAFHGLFLNGSTINGGIVVNGGELDAGVDTSFSLTHEPLVINGGITLNNAGDFDIEGATITGDVTSTGGFPCPFFAGCFDYPTFCGNTVDGSVAIRDIDRGKVTIGDPGEQFFANGECDANTVHGSIFLRNAAFTDPVSGEGSEIEGNSVSGSILVNASTGEFYGNTVGGSLLCTSGTINQPPPPDDPSGDTNTVRGANTC